MSILSCLPVRNVAAVIVCSMALTPLLADELPVDSTRFEPTVLAAGLKQPMELAVSPDGTVYFIELAGRIQAWHPKTRQVSTVGEITITTEQENGLIGLALDPNFATTQWIYLQYSPPDYPGQHISRFTIVDGQLDVSSEKLLLKFEEQRKECCHHAGSLCFGPDGSLFIATGDNTHPHGDSQGFAPIDERPERSPWDAQKSSANTQSLSGKILRIRPMPDGTIEIPDGNLFPKDGSLGRPEIYAMGCRNPWRMTVDQKTGFVYWGDVGPDANNDGDRGPRGYDEINQARSAGNFGWPYFIADNQPYADVDFATGTVGLRFNPQTPLNESPNNTGAKQIPPARSAFLYYPYGASEKFPELGSGGRSACAGPVYHFDPNLPSTTKFPAAYDGCLFIYEWTRHWIKAVHLDDDNQVQSIEPFMPGHTFVRPVDMAFGPEGSMYLLEYGETWGVNPDARLVRIDYVRGNRTPVAVATVQNNIGRPPLAVSLSSQGSFDKDSDDKLTFEWRLISAKVPESPVRVLSNEANPVVTLTDAGVFNVELVVTDSHGASRTSSVPVIVGNSRAAIRFASPAAGDFFDPEQPISYEVIVNDYEDGTNDDRLLDSESADVLDPAAPGRVSVNAVYSPGPAPTAEDSSAVSDQGPPGMRRMKGSDCFNCHAVDQKRIGPPLLEIANKYRDKEGALEASVQRVMKGSSGVWGKVPMIPHSHHTVDEVREMVGWIYSLQPTGLVRVFPGFVNEISVSPENSQQVGHYRLEATYLDLGAGEIPALSSSAVITLRSRIVEAESADVVNGPQILGSGSASGQRFVGAINHDHHLRFRSIPLDRVSRVLLRIASAGAGGSIEVHLDEPDGPLLAATQIDVNGEWEKFYDRIVELPPSTGRHDVVLKFVHPTKAGGLMNVDAVHFLP
jgi:cytochrome c